MPRRTGCEEQEKTGVGRASGGHWGPGVVRSVGPDVAGWGGWLRGGSYR